MPSRWRRSLRNLAHVRCSASVLFPDLNSFSEQKKLFTTKRRARRDRHFRKDYLPLYLNEFSFRHNFRKDPDMFAQLIHRCLSRHETVTSLKWAYGEATVGQRLKSSTDKKDAELRKLVDKPDFPSFDRMMKKLVAIPEAEIDKGTRQHKVANKGRRAR
jgi:hypothetical protein